MELSEKIGRNFYAMLSWANNEVIMSDKFNDEVKKEAFKMVSKSYDELNDDDKRYMGLAGMYALQKGQEILGELKYVSKEHKE